MIRLSPQLSDFKSALKCSRCDGELPIDFFMQDRKAATTSGRCPTCKAWISISLPKLRKKLIYLDQSFLSAISIRKTSPKSQVELSIYSKLLKLKTQQRIALVVSDVHSRETAGIPEAYVEERKLLWKFQNDLADGEISVDWEEVFIAQQRRIVAGTQSDEVFPISDIGLDDPHRFRIGMSYQSKNLWRQKIDQESVSPRNETNDMFRTVFENRAKDLPPNCNLQECASYVLQLWRELVREGINAWRAERDFHLRIEQIVTDIDVGRVSSIPSMDLSAPVRRIVGDVLEGSNADAALQRWLELLDDDTGGFGACAQIRFAFEAELTWRWLTSHQSLSGSTFNKEFGQSRHNDVNHVSTFLPYVDALTTDDDMRSLCGSEVVSRQLDQFPCKVFSSGNYAEFDSWLDALLNE